MRAYGEVWPSVLRAGCCHVYLGFFRNELWVPNPSLIPTQRFLQAEELEVFYSILLSTAGKIVQ